MKMNNLRKYPDANHQPRHLAASRKEGSDRRQIAYDKLTTQDKLAQLPPEPLCAKQRTRLLAQLNKPKAPKQEDTVVAVVEQTAETQEVIKVKPPTYMKGKVS